jgi:hypothetical protein
MASMNYFDSNSKNLFFEAEGNIKWNASQTKSTNLHRNGIMYMMILYKYVITLRIECHNLSESAHVQGIMYIYQEFYHGIEGRASYN